MESKAALQEQMLAAGRRLQEALRQESELNQRCSSESPGEILEQWKAVRELVSCSQDEYDAAVQRYREAVENSTADAGPSSDERSRKASS
jgi:hypothetical protein